MDPSSEAVDLLRAILAEVRRTNEILSGRDKQGRMVKSPLTAIYEALKKGPVSGSSAAPTLPVGYTAAQLALDTDKGNPRIKYHPKRWAGESMLERRMSECDPAFLDMFAENARWQADNPRKGEDGKPNQKDMDGAKWKRLDAARAEAWAVRIRAGAVQSGGSPPAPPPPDDDYD